MCSLIRYIVLFGIFFLIGGCSNIAESKTKVEPTQSIPQPESTIILDSRTPTEAETLVTPSPIPGREPTQTTSPAQTACLDEAFRPITIPTRQAPLEVRFLSDGNLWVWREESGDTVQISDIRDAQSFSFSTDGHVIAFTRGEPFHQAELWAIKRDGTNLRLLISAEQLYEILGEPTTTEFEYTDEILYIDWIDGGRALGFEVQRSYNAIGGCCDSGGTWQVDLTTRELSPWTPAKEIQNERLGLVSPDGSQLALVGEMGLTLVNGDGSNRRADVLTCPYIPQMEGGGFIAPMVLWAADSQSLAVITYSENIWEPEATFTTWRVPSDGAPAQELHTFSGDPFSVSLSPDQRYLAYRKASKPLSNDWVLHLATFDGRLDIVYAQGNLMDFWGWSPDGVHFVYGQDTTRAPYLGSVCGGAQPLLDPPVFPIWQITWVDPDRFVFTSGGDGPTDSELRLGTVGNGSLRIGSQQGDYASYQVVPLSKDSVE